MSRRILASIGMSLVLLGTSAAQADDPAGPSQEFSPALDIDYLWDGGALPFIYGSLAVALATDAWLKPPKVPRFFPATEGPALSVSDTVPNWTLGVYNIAGAGLIAVIDEPSRWYHLKGYGEALLTTAALTSLTKNLVGRRRPHYPGGDDPDRRRSFFSGHASMSAVTTVYMGLYLGKHVFPEHVGLGASVWKSAAWIALGTVLVGVPYSRVYDNRHYLSDVLTGAAVGSGLAVAFFAYQESRFDNAEASFVEKNLKSLSIIPDFKNRGLVLQTRW